MTLRRISGALEPRAMSLRNFKYDETQLDSDENRQQETAGWLAGRARQVGHRVVPDRLRDLPTLPHES